MEILLHYLALKFWSYLENKSMYTEECIIQEQFCHEKEIYINIAFWSGHREITKVILHTN